MRIKPTHAAGGFRRFGSGGTLVAAETTDETIGVQRHAHNMVLIRCMPRGYRTCDISGFLVVESHLEHPGIGIFLL